LGAHFVKFLKGLKKKKNAVDRLQAI